ncbi:hypothetical protein CANCADRAFT_116276 [Tortispora caseinolytica NRRL Y-17796]|uniref:FHA domain-containing protein n=1 Tax=Tortispora caseinolytica NRRL Y-17796 TaxID=767744 RepID=A0A1E4TH33_9ASCO|nr:hypothetical protein CANCADRAFT_116276 [Tortispora caseinolytica NRRL Y-17796]
MADETRQEPPVSEPHKTEALPEDGLDQTLPSLSSLSQFSNLPATTTTEEQTSHPPEDSPNESRVSAYARLDFDTFTFYLQTLELFLGRRSSKKLAHEDSQDKVDVDLGPSKSISRRHARIFFNFGHQRFEITITGRNGAFVNGTYVELGVTVPLTHNTRVQIGQIPFTFVLPDMPDDAKPELYMDALDIEENAIGKRKHRPSNADTEIVDEKKPRRKRSKAKTKSDQEITSDKESKPEKEPKADKDAKLDKKTKPKDEFAPYPYEELPEDQIPPEYRERPNISLSQILIEVIRKYGNEKGMSLSQIYRGIQESYPYFRYRPPGWQSSVRHNLSLNKVFTKASKEAKNFLWGLDEQAVTEMEEKRKRQAAQAKVNQESKSQNSRTHSQTVPAAPKLAANNSDQLSQLRALISQMKQKQQGTGSPSPAPTSNTASAAPITRMPTVSAGTACIDSASSARAADERTAADEHETPGDNKSATQTPTPANITETQSSVANQPPSSATIPATTGEQIPQITSTDATKVASVPMTEGSPSVKPSTPAPVAPSVSHAPPRATPQPATKGAAAAINPEVLNLLKEKLKAQLGDNISPQVLAEAIRKTIQQKKQAAGAMTASQAKS